MKAKIFNALRAVLTVLSYFAFACFEMGVSGHVRGLLRQEGSMIALVLYAAGMLIAVAGIYLLLLYKKPNKAARTAVASSVLMAVQVLVPLLCSIKPY